MSDDDMTIFEFSEDVSEAEAPEPLPVGEYNATITAAVGKVSQRGTKYAAVTFMIRPEEYPADYDPEAAPDGKTIIFRRVPLENTQQGRFMLRNFCEAVGATASKKIDLGDWIGLEARVEVDHDSYEGVTREQIVRVNAS